MCFCLESGPNRDISGRNSCHNGHTETTTERSLRNITHRGTEFEPFFSRPRGCGQNSMQRRSGLPKRLSYELWIPKTWPLSHLLKDPAELVNLWACRLNKFFGCVSLPKKCWFFQSNGHETMARWHRNPNPMTRSACWYICFFVRMFDGIFFQQP